VAAWRSVSGLAVWDIQARDFLRSVLQCVAQPVWVVDRDGPIVFANPAAVTALGYNDLTQLLGRSSHDTIHYKHPDGSPYPASECPMLRPPVTGESVSSDDDWFVRKDGSMFPVSYSSAPIELPSGRGAVVALSDIAQRRRLERAIREHDIAQARTTELQCSESRHRTMLEAAFDAIVSTDDAGRVTYCSGDARRPLPDPDPHPDAAPLAGRPRPGPHLPA
jgi:PAS domain S-box-containing protein